MKCISCNEEILENSPYCPYCGEAQPLAAPEVASINEQQNTDSEECMEQPDFVPGKDNSPVIIQDPSFTIPPSTGHDSEVTYNKKEGENAPPSESDLHDVFQDSEQQPSTEESITPLSEDSSADRGLLEERSEKVKLSGRWKKFSFPKKKKAPEETPLVNDDGYYTELYPTKNEKFPVSKGELIAKCMLLGLLLLSLALFMIYVIQ